MSSLTRWVLAHKRTVVISWFVLTLAGMAAAGPASDALEPGFSVPGKEGWETQQLIEARYGDTGGDTAPLVPVVTLPQGKTVASSGVLEDAGINEGALLPHEILIEGDTSPELVSKRLAAVEGIHGAVAPGAPDWRRGGAALVEAIPASDLGSDEGKETLASVREAAHAAGPDVRVGGQPASNDDFIDAVYGSFPLMIALIAVTTFLLLARALRSLLLPAKAVLLNIMSVAATWGALELIWQQGYGSELILDIQATGSIPSWLPLIVFAFLFGLSMDYEVFILSRMREEYDRTGRTDIAVIRGIGRTGRLVTSAALILFLAFVAMASGPGTELKMMATALAVGILLDATVIRALLVPSVVSLMGRWNWWLPHLPARLLRVQPSQPSPPAVKARV